MQESIFHYVYAIYVLKPGRMTFEFTGKFEYIKAKSRSEADEQALIKQQGKTEGSRIKNKLNSFELRFQ